MTTEEAIAQKTDKFVGEILEHADSVRVFVTFHQADSTKSYNVGGGNFYSQLGIVGEWLTRQNEIARQEVKRNDE